MTKTFYIKGHKLTTASTRRYVAFAVPRDVPAWGRQYIVKRSDNRATIQHEADKHRARARSMAVVVVDTVTGEEI